MIERKGFNQDAVDVFFAVGQIIRHDAVTKSWNETGK